MTNTFNKIFPSKNEDYNEEYALNGEGIENCVLRNLY
jgi:hypothetical protein